MIASRDALPKVGDEVAFKGDIRLYTYNERFIVHVGNVAAGEGGIVFDACMKAISDLNAVAFELIEDVIGLYTDCVANEEQEPDVYPGGGVDE